MTPRHAYTVRVLMGLLSNSGWLDRLWNRAPVMLPDPGRQHTEPEPDLFLLSTDDKEFMHRHPRADEVVLLIEVSDTSFEMDREIKYRLYARAGIPEYWVVDIPGGRIFVCREPAGDEYKPITLFSGDDILTFPAAPGFSLILKLKDLFKAD